MAQINIQDIVSRELTWDSIKELQSGDLVQIVNYREGRFELGLATIAETFENLWKQRIIRVSNAFIRDVNNLSTINTTTPKAISTNFLLP